MLNRAGELVGINFDRNRHGLVRNFVYTDVQARHIAVHSKAVLEALRKLYPAEPLVEGIDGEVKPTATDTAVAPYRMSPAQCASFTRPEHSHADVRSPTKPRPSRSSPTSPTCRNDSATFPNRAFCRSLLPAPRPIEDLLERRRSPDGRLCELVDGILVEKAMGFHEGGLAVMDRHA